MNYLLYSKATSTTGKNLIEALQAAGVDIKGGVNPPSFTPNKVIRWGSAVSLSGIIPAKILNKGQAIQSAANKLEALKILKKAKIRVPEFFTDMNQIEMKDFPVFGRKLHHVGGNDIVFCLQKSDLNAATKVGCSYFTKYIPTAREYRIHIFGELSIKASQKVLTEPERNKDPWIRNFDEGYIYHVPVDKLPKEARELAKQSVKALGLDFGAVDVIIGDDKKPYVLEVNTAPGLQTDNSIEVYVKSFKGMLN